jgi:hypothetical protein
MLVDALGGTSAAAILVFAKEQPSAWITPCSGCDLRAGRLLQRDLSVRDPATRCSHPERGAVCVDVIQDLGADNALQAPGLSSRAGGLRTRITQAVWEVVWDAVSEEQLRTPVATRCRSARSAPRCWRISARSSSVMSRLPTAAAKSAASTHVRPEGNRDHLAALRSSPRLAHLIMEERPAGCCCGDDFAEAQHDIEIVAVGTILVCRRLHLGGR